MHYLQSVINLRVQDEITKILMAEGYDLGWACDQSKTVWQTFNRSGVTRKRYSIGKAPHLVLIEITKQDAERVGSQKSATGVRESRPAPHRTVPASRPLTAEERSAAGERNEIRRRIINTKEVNAIAERMQNVFDPEGRCFRRWNR